LNDHNTGISKWTKNNGPWVLVWQKEFPNLSEARKFENLLKRQKGGSGFYNSTLISYCSDVLIKSRILFFSTAPSVAVEL